VLNEVKIKDLNSSDRVFKFDDHLIKVRLVKKEIFNNNKMFGPAALSLQLTTSICDEKGKAIPRKDGVYSILPHSVTIPVGTTNRETNQMKKGLEDILLPLIRQTVSWHKNLSEMDSLVAEWENKSTRQK